MSTENESMCSKPGHISWNELITSNTKASADFYTKLFGWEAAPYVPKGAPAAGGPAYTIFKTDASDRGVGGMMQAMQPGTPTHWLPYVEVTNADASLAAAAKLGAKVLMPVTAMGEVGRIAVFMDPQGATIGLHEMPKR